MFFGITRAAVLTLDQYTIVTISSGVSSGAYFPAAPINFLAREQNTKVALITISVGGLKGVTELLTNLSLSVPGF